MKVLKKVLCFVLIFCAFCLIGCGKGDTINVGIFQYVTDGALDDATSGIKAALEEEGFIDGENITIHMYNPQADASTMQQLAERSVKECDIIFAIATPVALTLKNEVEKQGRDVQVFFTAVTSPTESHIIESNENPGGFITGTNDMNPVAAQIDLALDLLPGKTASEIKVGVLYTATESNSIIQVGLAEAECNRLGMTLVKQPINSVTDLENATLALIRDVDVIYIPTDNVISASVSTVTSKANLNGIPTICGEGSMLDKGGTITYGISYVALGKLTGKMAAKFLNGEVAKAGDIPSTGMAQEDLELVINFKDAATASITIPEALRAKADKVIE